MPTVAGDNLSLLPSAIMEHVRPGQRADLIVGLKADVSDDALAGLEQQLNQAGLRASVAFGRTSKWEHALRVQFIRPRLHQGVSFLPLPVLLVGALGAVAVGGIVGFKLGNVLDSVARNLPLIILAGAATVVAVALIRQQGRAREVR